MSEFTLRNLSKEDLLSLKKSIELELQHDRFIELPIGVPVKTRHGWAIQTEKGRYYLLRDSAYTTKYGNSYAEGVLFYQNEFLEKPEGINFDTFSVWERDFMNAHGVSETSLGIAKLYLEKYHGDAK